MRAKAASSDMTAFSQAICDIGNALRHNSAQELRAERELAGPRAEAQLDQHRLVPGADDGLAVDALERQLAAATAGDERRQRLERRVQARVAGLAERDDPAAALLDVQQRL